MHLDDTGERVIVSRNPDWFWERLPVEHVARYLFASRHVRGGNLLDAATGTGYGAAILGRLAEQVVGVDISAEAIEHARRLWGSEKVIFAVSDVLALPFADRTFDAVTCFETIEHVVEPQNLLVELDRVLRPGGVLVISTPDRDVYNWVEHAAGPNPFHVSEMTAKEFSCLLSAHFRVDELRGQVHVPDYRPGVVRQPIKTRRGWMRMARQVIAAAGRRLIRSHDLALALTPVVHRRFMPQRLDDEPWKYVVAVCRKDVDSGWRARAAQEDPGQDRV